MTENGYQIGIIGSEEAIMGFIPLGVVCFPVREDGDIAEIAAKIRSGRFAAVFITEDWAERARPVLDAAFSNEALPAVVTVPSPRGATGAGLAALKKIVEQAVGSDILFNK